jgi:hypothetical protein
MRNNVSHTSDRLEPGDRGKRLCPIPGDEPAAWRVKDWLRLVPISRSHFYGELAAGRIRTVKSGARTLVVTSPAQYLAALAARNPGAGLKNESGARKS